MNTICRGNIIRTSLSDQTVVLEYDGKDAILFAKNQYIQAHDLHFDEKENRYVWMFGRYTESYPTQEEKDASDWSIRLIQAFLGCKKDEAWMLINNSLNIDENLILYAIQALKENIEAQLPHFSEHELSFNALMRELHKVKKFYTK